jgi:hypothetical protein
LKAACDATVDLGFQINVWRELVERFPNKEVLQKALVEALRNAKNIDQEAEVWDELAHPDDEVLKKCLK